MVNPFITAIAFLINVIFGTYILFIILRFLVQLMRVGLRGDPLLRFLWKITDPPLRLLYNFIPGWRNWDFAAILLILLLKMSEHVLINWLYGNHFNSVLGLLLLTCADVLSLLLNIFFFTILIEVLLSWISPYDAYNNSLSYLLRQLNEPILRPVRRRISQRYGIDFSPFIVLIGLQLIIILLVDPLRYLGISHGMIG